MKRHSFTQSCMLITAIISTSTALAVAQPQGRPGQDQQRDPEQRAQRENDQAQRPGKKMLEIRINADALRSRINRSIARAEKMLSIHNAALEKLDEGASPTEVLAAMKIQGFSRNALSEQRGPGSGLGPGPGAGSGLGPGSRSDETPRPGGPPERLSTDDREEMYHFLQDNFPELWKNLEPIAKIDPKSADRLLARMSPQIREIMLLREAQPGLAALKIEEMHAGLMFVEASRVFRATIKNTASTDSDRADAMANLRSAAAKRFDVQFKAKQHEISMLEARLDELKSSVNGIQEMREDTIERMLASATRNQRGQGKKSSRAPNQRDSGND